VLDWAQDVRWLVADATDAAAPWDGKVRHASDYFETLYQSAVHLIECIPAPPGAARAMTVRRSGCDGACGFVRGSQEGQGVRRLVVRGGDEGVPRDAQAAGQGLALPHAQRGGEPRALRGHAERRGAPRPAPCLPENGASAPGPRAANSPRVETASGCAGGRGGAHCARQDRHGLAQHQHARPRHLPRAQGRAPDDRRQVVHLPDVGARPPAPLRAPLYQKRHPVGA
jgi:hypothetical protein